MALIKPHINFNGNAKEAIKLFKGLSAGGEIEMPISESPRAHILVCLEINMELNGW